jgi:hypothetical protein
VKEVAQLKGCSRQNIIKQTSRGNLEYKVVQAANRTKKFYIPLSTLEPALQSKYYKQKYGEVPSHLQKAAKKPAQKKLKPLEGYTAEQREQIARWTQIIKDWQDFRSLFGGPKSEADAEYVKTARALYPEESISKDILYRKQAALRNNDLDGLIDKRGSWKKGKSSTPTEIKDLFLYTYLDEKALPIKKCMEATRLILQEERPELLDKLPAYDTFYRWAKECPMPVATLARAGEKAFNDRCGLFVDRLYDDMQSNDYWIADGHSIDVITQGDDGARQTHRLTLSAFIDARSGIYVGWVVTDNPSSDATLCALRKAIKQYGIPRYLYVDNGREYLNYDIGGMGHRARKRHVDINLPTPILSRLGIQMTNAIPRNAQAKIIEREFRNFTFLSQLFETWTGSNPVVKPEKLKHKLKAGRIPTDGELTQVVEDMIEGYFNQQIYNGKVVTDRGRTRYEVYNAHLGQVRRAAEEDLNLMMMRSTRLQTIGQNGVYVRVSGEKIYYFCDELFMMQGQKVFVRYDPEVMDAVRIYDENEKYLLTAPIQSDMMLDYFATKDELAHAMQQKRSYRRKTKDIINLQHENIVSQYGHINMLDLFVRAAKSNREGLLVAPDTNVVEMVIPEERKRVAAVANGTDCTPVQIDRLRMIKNNER